jgi:hypothetical protein
MRGEFIAVWSETWREIWSPLIDQEGVPDDIFSELYRELAIALKEPFADDAVAFAINDAIQLREAFDRALVIAGTEIDLARRDKVFDGSRAVSLDGDIARREALETALETVINDPARSRGVLSQAISELADNPQKRAEALERARESIINDTLRSRKAFEQMQASNLAGERALVTFLEGAYGIFDDLGGEQLGNLYFNLLDAFVVKFSLRYDLRRPCTLCPTLPGVFASLMRDLRTMTSRDAHLDSLMKDFENALRDLRIECSDARIRNCIQKQVIFLEALGQKYPGVTEDTLGAICGQVGTWPHNKVQEAMKNLYKFTNNYPGIRHPGTPASALRVIDMRDLVAMSILLAGFTPYLSDLIDAEVVYRGR